MRGHSASLSEPLRSAFDILNQHRIEYVVLRGYLPLSALDESPDIDVYIPAREMARAVPLLGAAGWLRRRSQVGRYPHVFLDHLGNGGRFATVFDVVTGLSFGRDLHELRDPEAVLRSSRISDGVRMPSPWHALFLLSLHLLLDKEHLLERHMVRMERHWADCRSSGVPSSQLSEDFGPEALALCTDLAKALPEDPANSLQTLRKRALSLRCVRAHPVFAAGHRIVLKLRSRRQRPVRVGVVGLDGAGKSTLIERFERTSGIPTGSGYLGYNHFVSPVVRALVQKIDALARDESRRDGATIRLLDALLVVIWPMESFLRVRRAEAGRMLVFYDRYPIPGLNPPAPQSSRFGSLRRWVERLGSSVIPDADVILFFDGDAEVIWKRKQEYSLEVFLETQARYRRVVERLQCERYTIDTSQPIADTCARMTTVLAQSPTVRQVLYS